LIDAPPHEADVRYNGVVADAENQVLENSEMLTVMAVDAVTDCADNTSLPPRVVPIATLTV
jgi:hypothetical protein